MKAAEKFEKETFIVDGRGDVQSMTFGEYLTEYYSDETTSPRGCEPRLFIEHTEAQVFSEMCEDGDTSDDVEECWHVREWQTNGTSREVAGPFATEEEAEVYILERWEYSYLTLSCETPPCFDTEIEAHSWRLGADLDEEVVLSILKKEEMINNARNQREEESKKAHQSYIKKVYDSMTDDSKKEAAKWFLAKTKGNKREAYKYGEVSNNEQSVIICKMKEESGMSWSAFHEHLMQVAQ